MKPRTIKVVQAVGGRYCFLAPQYGESDYDSGIIPEGEPVLEIDTGDVWRGDKKSYISMAGLRIARDFLQNNIPPILEDGMLRRPWLAPTDPSGKMCCIITGNNLMDDERYIISYTPNRRISLNGINLGIQALSNYPVKCSWYPNYLLFPGWCN